MAPLSQSDDPAIKVIIAHHDAWLAQAKKALHKSKQRMAAEIAQELFEIAVEIERQKVNPIN